MNSQIEGNIMNPAKPQGLGYQSRTLKNTLGLLYWGIPWVGTCMLMTFGPKVLWNHAEAFTALAICLNVAVGVGLLLAHKKYIKELDELQRKIYLNALAITVGVGLIAGVPFQVMDANSMLPFHANISHLIMIMSVTFVVSTVYGSLRYR
jgi:hypothetical protein